MHIVKTACVIVIGTGINYLCLGHKLNKKAMADISTTGFVGQRFGHQWAESADIESKIVKQ